MNQKDSSSELEELEFADALQDSVYLFSTMKAKEGALRLALLKENFRFRKFWNDHINDVKKASKTIISTKMPETYTDPKDEWYWETIAKVEDFKERLTESFLINDILWEVLPFEKALDFLDPHIDSPGLDNKTLEVLLSLLFFEPGITAITETSEPLRYELPEHNYNYEESEPYKRMLIVDLRKKRAQLEKEFKVFLDRVEGWQRSPSGIKEIYAEDYDRWEQNKGRYRQEAWEHLRIWNARKHKKSFPEIAMMFKIKDDTAKKRFYRAYELTQDSAYDRETFKREVWIRRIPKLKNICKECINRETCTDLCPDALEYVDQDHIALKEKLLKEDSDAFKDYLAPK